MPTTPPGKVPFWLRLLLPSLDGIENNPLYIRLSGQGFGGQRRGPFGSRLPEYAFRWDSLLFRVGLLPWALTWLSWMLQPMPLLFVAPALVLGYRVVFGDTRSRLREVVRNIGDSSRGEELALTPMSAHDYDRAVLAATLPIAAVDACVSIVAVVGMVALGAPQGLPYAAAIAAGFGIGQCLIKLSWGYQSVLTTATPDPFQLPVLIFAEFLLYVLSLMAAIALSLPISLLIHKMLPGSERLSFSLVPVVYLLVSLHIARGMLEPSPRPLIGLEIQALMDARSEAPPKRE